MRGGRKEGRKEGKGMRGGRKEARKERRKQYFSKELQERKKSMSRKAGRKD